MGKQNLFGEQSFSEIFDTVSKKKLVKNAFDSANTVILSESKLNFEDNNVVSNEQYIRPRQEYRLEFNLQKTIRDFFGKPGVNYSTIAEHPDFKHLESYGDPIYQYICTMFVDIKGSTALSLKYDLELVYNFKNAVIQACIECIRAFDGYVHRIMGDAVLGFFGSKSISEEQAILDCMNCAAVLNLYLVQNIKPSLAEKFPDFNSDYDFGFRIGCNFGKHEEVLWGNYGFGRTGEVSPTGLPVDLAAKLQGLSSKNKAMLGEGLLRYFNWPKNFSKIKMITEKNETKEMNFVEPNYTVDGKPINYLMRELKQNEYIKGLPFPLEIKEAVVGSELKNNQKINLKCYVKEKNSLIWASYLSSSKVIERGAEIKFKLLVNNDLSLGFPLKIKFIKENEEGFGDNHPEMMRYLKQKDEELKEMKLGYENLGASYILPNEYEIIRDCKYKGLHKMICEVRNSSNVLIFRDIVHVPIA